MENDKWTNLKKLRDELKLQGHLFNMDAKDRWNDLEQKFSKLNSKVGHTLEVTGEVNKELWEANKFMIDEVKEGYQKIKNSLQ